MMFWHKLNNSVELMLFILVVGFLEWVWLVLVFLGLILCEV